MGAVHVSITRAQGSLGLLWCAQIAARGVTDAATAGGRVASGAQSGLATMAVLCVLQLHELKDMRRPRL